MWRYDSARSAVSTDSLPDARPSLIWQHTFTPRVQVWDSPLNNFLMQYDKAFEPIVFGHTLLIGFNDSDKMVAIDTRSGAIQWTYFCDGPIRLEPVAAEGAVYFGSDDGFFYCLNISTGEEVWKFNAAPASKKLIGNRRVISMWPIRGGPVVEDGTVYFSSGIWPFMGVFIYALDAETGQVVWLNDHDSIKYRAQPHKPSMAFASVSPQGAFAVNKERLIVPGGRSVPAILDRETGEMLRYDFDKQSKNSGGDFTASGGDYYYTRERQGPDALGVTQVDIEGKSKAINFIQGTPVVADGITYASGKTVRAYQTDQTGKIQSLTPLWTVDADARGDLIRAGTRLYAAGGGQITAIDLTRDAPSVAWTLPVKGTIVRLVAADDHLFAVTEDGCVMAFGKGKMREVAAVKKPLATTVEEDSLVDELLAQTKSRSGWALMTGLDDISLAVALIKKTEHDVIILDPSAEKVARARKLLDDAGIYGTSVTAQVGTPSSFDLAPYAIELAVTGPTASLSTADTVKLLENLRPYGGTLFILGPKDATKLPAGITSQGYSVEKGKLGMVVTRRGALKGAAPWTHNYGSIAQTAKSDDRRVKLPLGVLWWGGSSNMDVLPRHAHGPSEQVIGGRLFIQGTDSFSARDVYTGRILWKRELPQLNTVGVFFTEAYDPDPLAVGYNQDHKPGANMRGSNFVATEDILYVLQDEKCLMLNVETGETIKTLYLPGKVDWGYIGVQDDLLIAGSDFTQFVNIDGKIEEPHLAEEINPQGAKKKSRRLDDPRILNKSASQKLVVMNRHTGQVVWTTTAEHGYLHNGIAVGDQTLFAIDRVPTYLKRVVMQRGKSMPAAKLIAYNLKDGTVKWEKLDDIFGSFSSFSLKHKILLHSTRPSRDIYGEGKGTRMLALKSADGSVIWDSAIEYNTFPILHSDRIITESGAWDLLTGKPVFRINPITDCQESWSWKRTYGCNYPIASENLLTFRSGAASFYDLQGDGGTGSFGGFKSGCSANLIVADGVLSAPDYTRTCTCPYQNQTSLAMVHMPDLEFWTTSTILKPKDKTIHRIGLNFGAPGDRKEGKTFWVDYPSVGGESPDPTVRIVGAVKWHLGNAARFGDAEKNWVYASCAENLNSVTLQLEGGESRESSASGKEASEELIRKSDEWAYLAGKKPADNWVERHFDDSAWARGKAGFGYGDDDDATELKDMKGEYASVFIRKTFSISDPSKVSALSLRIGYDDYFTAYINGKKVASTRGGHERKRGIWDTFEIPLSKLLLKGQNVIVIEGHNLKAQSTDFSLDPYLVAKVSGSPGTVSERVDAKQSSEVGDVDTYTVRLYFAEPFEIKPEDRVFDLSLNGKTVIENLDVLTEAGACRVGIVKEFRRIQCADGNLTVTMTPRTLDMGAILSGLEIIKE